MVAGGVCATVGLALTGYDMVTTPVEQVSDVKNSEEMNKIRERKRRLERNLRDLENQ